MVGWVDGWGRELLIRLTHHAHAPLVLGRTRLVQSLRAAVPVIHLEGKGERWGEGRKGVTGRGRVDDVMG